MLDKETKQELIGDINNTWFILSSIKQKLKQKTISKNELVSIHQDLSFEIPSLESVLAIIESCLEESR